MFNKHWLIDYCIPVTCQKQSLPRCIRPDQKNPDHLKDKNEEPLEFYDSPSCVSSNSLLMFSNVLF